MSGNNTLKVSIPYWHLDYIASGQCCSRLKILWQSLFLSLSCMAYVWYFILTSSTSMIRSSVWPYTLLSPLHLSWTMLVKVFFLFGFKSLFLYFSSSSSWSFWVDVPEHVLTSSSSLLWLPISPSSFLTQHLISQSSSSIALYIFFTLAISFSLGTISHWLISIEGLMWLSVTSVSVTMRCLRFIFYHIFLQNISHLVSFVTS